MINTLSEIQISYSPKPFANSVAITSPSQMANVFRELFDETQLSVREECISIYLNRANKINGWYKVSSGGISSTIVDIRLILSIAVKSLSSNIVLAHTHPSGSLKPSNQDLALTCKLKEAAKILDVSLLDHMILTTDNYFSFAENGFL